MQNLTDVPERTLRYRLDRLWKLGLCGGRQPYVPNGSAPYHWYPSKLADSYARGAPLPKGGEKEDPSEQFLEHAAAITGFFVALQRLGPSLEMETLSFAREAEGREVFRSEPRESAIVPDANIILRSDEAQYHALVEIDLGTMSMTRLAAKLGVYLSYARSGAWRAEHSYLPPLLFLTTTPRRVEEIIKRFRVLAVREERRIDDLAERDVLDGFAIAACQHARDGDTALTEPVWVGRDGIDELTFTDLLREPWERWHARNEAMRETERKRLAYRERVLTDPEAHRHAIQARRDDPKIGNPYRENYASEEYSSHLWELDDNEEVALAALIDSVAPMTSLERNAYRFFLVRTKFDEHGRACATWSDAKRPLTEEEHRAIAELVALMLRRQRETVAELWGRYPMLPCVLRWIRGLDVGELVGTHTWRNLQTPIDADLARFGELDARVSDYRAWREGEARRKRERLGALKQISYAFARALADVDEEQIRCCATCAALAVPEIDKHLGARWPYEGPACLFCGRRDALLHLADAQEQGFYVRENDFPGACPVSVPGWVRAVPLTAFDPARPDEEAQRP